ncbi:hypothetical protein HO133_006051 [Letharia lupina]|uniref:Uncharacterized protein n=1 Tax=Letharia lupina TaxID=560253 RepID=A0A8H6C838_9LECA|nr:uncharacterized protein HO133_006051 [Letharia lupina]KAF6218700.1 hypothetical protein HO133_006051 [Letharia lupina]
MKLNTNQQFSRITSAANQFPIILEMPDQTKNPEGTGPITDAKVTTQTRLLDGLARPYLITATTPISFDDDTVSGDNKLDSNARTCAMADEYDIAFLKTLSECMLQAQLDGLTGDDMPRFLQAVRTIDTTTPGSDPGLRDLDV